MKHIFLILICALLLSCQDDKKFNEAFFKNTFDITAYCINNNQNELSFAKNDNPNKATKWFEIGESISNLTTNFYSIDGKEFSKANSEYIEIRSELINIAETHHIEITENKKIEKITSTEDFYLAALDIRLLETQLLASLVHNVGLPFCGWRDTDVKTNGIQNEDEYSFKLISDAFQKSKLNSVTIDSIFKNGVMVSPNILSNPDSTFWKISIQNLYPGEYKVYGTTHGFGYSSNTKIESNFQHSFEIKENADKSE